MSVSRVRIYPDDVVIPMDRTITTEIPIALPIRIKNIMNDVLSVRATVSGISDGPNNYLMGDVPVGQTRDMYVDGMLRRLGKPATNTEETITMKLDYYWGTRYVHTEYVYYNFVYVNFNDGSYTVVDEDTFEADLGGWIKIDEVGATVVARSNTISELSTGKWSMKHSGIDAGDVAYLSKSFTIGDVDRAFFRTCVYGLFDLGTSKIMLELITDAGEVVKKRVVRLPLTGGNNLHSMHVSDLNGSWAFIGGRLPVNGTYDVQLKATGITGTVDLYYDDIKVVQS